MGRQPLTAISDALETAKRDRPRSTVWFIGQVWSWPNTRLVTPREHRAMSYLALTHANVRGLFWYSFRDPDWYLPESNPAVWEMCARVNRELEALEPVLLERNRWERVIGDGEGEVHCAAKVHDRMLHVIAVCPTEQGADLRLNVRREGPASKAIEIFEKRELTLEDGILEDRFESLDARVYRLTLP